jgi:hypothetical protein
MLGGLAFLAALLWVLAIVGATGLTRSRISRAAVAHGLRTMPLPPEAARPALVNLAVNRCHPGTAAYPATILDLTARGYLTAREPRPGDLVLDLPAAPRPQTDTPPSDRPVPTGPSQDDPAGTVIHSGRGADLAAYDLRLLDSAGGRIRSACGADLAAYELRLLDSVRGRIQAGGAAPFAALAAACTADVRGSWQPFEADLRAAARQLGLTRPRFPAAVRRLLQLGGLVVAALAYAALRGPAHANVIGAAVVALLTLSVTCAWAAATARQDRLTRKGSALAAASLADRPLLAAECDGAAVAVAAAMPAAAVPDGPNAATAGYAVTGGLGIPGPGSGGATGRIGWRARQVPAATPGAAGPGVTGPAGRIGWRVGEAHAATPGAAGLEVTGPVVPIGPPATFSSATSAIPVPDITGATVTTSTAGLLPRATGLPLATSGDGVGLGGAGFGMPLNRRARAVAVGLQLPGGDPAASNARHGRPAGDRRPDEAWSSASGSWRLVSVPPRRTPNRGGAALAGAGVFGLWACAAVILPGLDGVIVPLALGAVAAGVGLVGVRALRRWYATPEVLEFDAQVIATWAESRDSETSSADVPCLCVDDGELAWTFEAAGPVAQVAVGDTVHLVASPRSLKLLDGRVVTQVAERRPEPGQQVPPAVELLTAADVAGLVGAVPRVTPVPVPSGTGVIYKGEGSTLSLTVTSGRTGRLGRRLARQAGDPVPGLGDQAWIMSSGRTLLTQAGPVTVKLTLQGGRRPDVLIELAGMITGRLAAATVAGAARR